MLKVSKIINDKPVKVGNFKSYVAFADWLDRKPKGNIGTYYVLSANCQSPAGVDRVIYDGLCTSDRRGNI